MKTQNKKVEKTRLVIGGVLAVLAAIGIIIWGVMSWENNPSFSALLMIAAAILLVLFGAFVFNRRREVEKGMPIEDERSKRVMEKAASMSFYITIYLMLAVGMFSDRALDFTDVSQAISFVILCMAVVFFLSWVYYNRRGV